MKSRLRHGLARPPLSNQPGCLFMSNYDSTPCTLAIGKMPVARHGAGSLRRNSNSPLHFLIASTTASSNLLKKSPVCEKKKDGEALFENSEGCCGAGFLAVAKAARLEHPRSGL